MAHPFDPLEAIRYLNFERIYDQFSHTIDLIIFFMLFYGLSHSILSHKFKGKGGNLVCIATAAALSIGMLLIEQQIGFSLKTFGGVGLLAMFAVIAVLIFQMCRSFELGISLSLSISYLLLFFGLNAVSPEIFNWFIEMYPTLHLILFIIFMLSIGIVIVRLFKGLMPKIKIQRTPKMNPKIKETIAEPHLERPGKLELKDEKKAAKEIRKETNTELKEAKTIIHILQIIIKRLHREGITAQNKPDFAKAITKISRAEHVMEIEIGEQKTRFERLESATNPMIQKEVQKLEKLQSEAINDVKNFKYRLHEGISGLRANDKEHSILHLSEAERVESDLKGKLRELKREEKRILKRIKKDEKLS
jgi:hypothetical protein